MTVLTRDRRDATNQIVIPGGRRSSDLQMSPRLVILALYRLMLP